MNFPSDLLPERPSSPAALATQWRPWLERARLIDQSRQLRPEMLAAAAAIGLLGLTQAHDRARALPDPALQAEALTRLALVSQDPVRREALLNEALAAARAVSETEKRLERLEALWQAGLASAGPEALAAAAALPPTRGARGNAGRARGLGRGADAAARLNATQQAEGWQRIVDWLPAEHVNRAWTLAGAASDARTRARALALLVPRLPASTLADAAAAANREEAADAFPLWAALLPRLPAARQAAVLQEQLERSRRSTTRPAELTRWPSCCPYSPDPGGGGALARGRPSRHRSPGTPRHGAGPSGAPGCRRRSGRCRGRGVRPARAGVARPASRDAPRRLGANVGQAPDQAWAADATARAVRAIGPSYTLPALLHELVPIYPPAVSARPGRRLACAAAVRLPAHADLECAAAVRCRTRCCRMS